MIPFNFFGEPATLGQQVSPLPSHGFGLLEIAERLEFGVNLGQGKFVSGTRVVNRTARRIMHFSETDIVCLQDLPKCLARGTLDVECAGVNRAQGQIHTEARSGSD